MARTPNSPDVSRMLVRYGPLVSLALLAAACAKDSAWTPVSRSETQSSVTGAAAAALDESGRFRLPSEVTNPEGHLSQDAAESIALRFVHEFGRFNHARWQQEHGSPIDLARLTICDRAFLVGSAYRIPPDAPEELQNSLGSRWIVSLCEGTSRPAVTLSFAARLTTLLTNDRVAFIQAVPRGGFVSVGIPLHVGSTVPASPEEAVVRVSQFSGRRVAEIPTLVRPAHPQSDLLSRWSTALESEVPVRFASGGTTSTGSLLVGFGSDFKSRGVFARGGGAPQPTLVMKDREGRDWVLELIDARPLGAVSLAGDPR